MNALANSTYKYIKITIMIIVYFGCMLSIVAHPAKS